MCAAVCVAVCCGTCGPLYIYIPQVLPQRCFGQAGQQYLQLYSCVALFLSPQCCVACLSMFVALCMHVKTCIKSTQVTWWTITLLQGACVTDCPGARLSGHGVGAVGVMPPFGVMQTPCGDATFWCDTNNINWSVIHTVGAAHVPLDCVSHMCSTVANRHRPLTARLHTYSVAALLSVSMARLRNRLALRGRA